MSRHAAGLLMFLALPGCRGATTNGGGQWQVFDAYPGARQLCTQRVYPAGAGAAHFTWWAHVTPDPLATVTSFYTARHEKLRAADVEDWFSLRGPRNETLSVHEASAGNYPHCDRRPGPADRTVIIVSSADGAPAKAVPLRFDRATRGCGDAHMVAESADGTRFLTIGLDRKKLALTTEPKTFRIEDRPDGLDIAVFAYSRRPPYTTHCTDLAAPQGEVSPTRLAALRGRVTAAVSTTEPVPLACYTVSVRLEGVAFADAAREVPLEGLHWPAVTVGGLPPIGCQPWQDPR